MLENSSRCEAKLRLFSFTINQSYKTVKEKCMNQKFSKKELERLGCNEEEVKLVMDYQKKLPIIVDEDFVTDARELHNFLGVGKHFSTWIKSRIEKYRFIKDLDYKIHYKSDTPNSGDTDFTTFSPNQLARMEVRVEYSLTSNMTKELCTIENNEIGRTARKYFILMESLVKRNKDWWDVRNPERKEYNDMCEALSNNIYRNCGRYADKYDYSRQANILNRIATGSSALEIRNYFNIHNQNELTRDSLEKDYNEKLAFLQKQNIIYLGLNMPIVERIKLLIASFDVLYPTASPVLPWLSRDNMLQEREKLLKELES
jgi:phage anti-repressor protein